MAQRVIFDRGRIRLAAWTLSGVLAAGLLANAPANAAVLVEIATDVGDVSPDHRAMLLDQLEARGEVMLTGADTAAAWSTHVIDAPNASADEAFVDQAITNATGRNLFFENEFEQSIALLSRGVEALQADPSVLAFHPDLAPAAFDAGLTLVRAYDAMGMADSAERTIETMATLMWGAEPATTEFSPGFIADFDAVKALMPTRAVRVEFVGASDCSVRVNGFAVPVGDDGLRLPSGPQFVVVECDGESSNLYRLDPRRASVRFDLAFDDAASLDGDRIVLRPRSSAPDALRRVAAQVAHVVGETAVYTIAPAADAGANGEPMLEFTRVQPGGSPPFRAVRVVVGDMDTEARMHAAVEYLVSGQTNSGVAVWHPESGWTEPTGIEFVRSPRPVASWVLAGVALGGVGAAIVFETRVSESTRDLDECYGGLADRTCGAEALPGLRSDARSARGIANGLWIGAAAAATAAVVSLLVRRPAGHDVAAARRTVFAGPVSGGAFAGFSWTN